MGREGTADPGREGAYKSSTSDLPVVKNTFPYHGKAWHGGHGLALATDLAGYNLFSSGSAGEPFLSEDQADRHQLEAVSRAERTWEHHQGGKGAETAWAEAPESSSLAAELKEGSPALGSYQLGTSTLLLLSSYLEITLNSWQKVRVEIKCNQKVQI